MGARLNRIDPYTPPVYVDRAGREFSKMPGQPRKVPPATRKRIYELDRTVRECKKQIRALFDECGVSAWHDALTRIRGDRG